MRKSLQLMRDILVFSERGITMAKRSNTKNLKQVVKNQLTQKLEESQERFREQYGEMLNESKLSNESRVSDTRKVTGNAQLPDTVQGERKFKNPEEDLTMAKNFDFEQNEQQDFGAGAKDTTAPITSELPDVDLGDEAAFSEEKANTDSTSGASAKATTGKYEGDLMESARKNIANFEQKFSDAVAVSNLLSNTMKIVRFVTNNTFGRGFAMTTTKLSNSDASDEKSSHFKVEVLKPGRPKSVVVQVPKIIADILTENAKKNSAVTAKALLSGIEGGKLTEEQKKDVVSLVMGYDDLMVRVANLCEGKIPEALINGAKRAVAENAYRTSRDNTTGAYVEKAIDLTGKTAQSTIDGVQHVIYTMKQPDTKLLGKGIDGAEFSEADKKAIERYKAGKVPLKRTQGAYSALFTKDNFVSLTQYNVAQPFSDKLTHDEAVRLSAKAVFHFNKRGESAPRIESYDANLINGDIAAVFDESIDAATRLEMLQTAKNYVRTKADGTPLKRKVRQQDANGKSVYVEVDEVAADVTLADRVLKDFYTGKQISAEDAKKVAFVMYGESGVNKKGDATAPRVQKRKLSFAGMETEADASKGIVGVFGLDDASVSAFVKEVGEETAKEAFVKAATRSSNSNNSADGTSDLEAGLLAAMLTQL